LLGLALLLFPFSPQALTAYSWGALHLAKPLTLILHQVSPPPLPENSSVKTVSAARMQMVAFASNNF